MQNFLSKLWPVIALEPHLKRWALGAFFIPANGNSVDCNSRQNLQVVSPPVKSKFLTLKTVDHVPKVINLAVYEGFPHLYNEVRNDHCEQSPALTFSLRAGHVNHGGTDLIQNSRCEGNLHNSWAGGVNRAAAALLLLYTTARGSFASVHLATLATSARSVVLPPAQNTFNNHHQAQQRENTTNKTDGRVRGLFIGCRVQRFLHCCYTQSQLHFGCTEVLLALCSEGSVQRQRNFQPITF